MNYQHFSHQHILIPLSLPEEEEELLICNACHNPIAADECVDPATHGVLHGCLPCKFYVHDRCMGAPRWLDHPAHPPHPLTLFPSATYSHASFFCGACGLPGGRSSSCFGCAKCEFDLHLHCAALPETVVIDAHPHHHLKLHYKHKSSAGSYSCDVCSNDVDTRFWSYRCAKCNFDCHVNCATAMVSYRGSSSASSAQPPRQWQWPPPRYDAKTKAKKPQSESESESEEEEEEEEVEEEVEEEDEEEVEVEEEEVKEEEEEVEDEEEEEVEEEKSDGNVAADDVVSSMARLMEQQNQMRLQQMQLQMRLQQSQMIASFGRSLANL